MSKKLLVVMAALLIVSLGLAGCGQKPAAQEAKVLKVGAEMTFAPFEFQDEKSKQYVGFDMDLIQALGKQMGYKVEIQSMGFDALIPALATKNIDAVCSAMSITPERSQKVLFSKPYYKSGLSIVVKNDNNSINGFKDLEGKRIAVQIGTTGAEEAKKIKDAKVREFNTMSDVFMELKAGGVDAVVNDLPVNKYYLVQIGSKDAKMVGETLNAEEYGIAVDKNNKELIEKVNKALEEIQKNGEYDKIYEKWFGEKPQK